jgi:hypothetical protein
LDGVIVAIRASVPPTRRVALDLFRDTPVTVPLPGAVGVVGVLPPPPPPKRSQDVIAHTTIAIIERITKNFLRLFIKTPPKYRLTSTCQLFFTLKNKK